MDKLNTAYQKKNLSLKANLRLKSVHIIKMDEEKDDLKSIKVYKFNNMKENWHEFAQKFRVIAHSRGYDGIIDGAETPPDEKEIIEILVDDKEDVLKTKKDKLKARTANKKGYRDLVMSTEGISLNIVENVTSDKLTKGDLKKAWGRLERRWNTKTREDKVEVYVEKLQFSLFLISCSQVILSSSCSPGIFSERLLVYVYLSQLMRTFTNYLKCIVFSS